MRFLTADPNPVSPPPRLLRLPGTLAAGPENAKVTGFGEIRHFDPSLYGRDYKAKALIFSFLPLHREGTFVLENAFFFDVGASEALM